MALSAAESPAVDHLQWETKQLRLGIVGLNLVKPIDNLDPNELAIMTNVVGAAGGGVSPRPALSRLFTFGGAAVHSVQRWYNPQTLDVMHFWGRDIDWGRAEGNTIAALEGGFSGDPLTMIQAETELGLSKIYVADRFKMRRAGLTSASEPIGLPKPAVPVVKVNAASRKTICQFDASDGTQAATWTGIGTYDTDGKGLSGNPIFSDIPAPTSNGVNLASVAGNATTNYSQTMEHVLALDLTTFDDAKATTDDDIIHLSIRIDFPTHVDEIKVYFVVSPFTMDAGPLTALATPALIPGVTATANLASYLHVYRPSDYADMVGNVQTAQLSAVTARQAELLKKYARTRPPTAPPIGIAIPRNTPPDATFITPATPGANTWIEFGKIGLPVRRGEFMKVGSAGTAGTDWSTVTGIYIVVTMKENVNANVAFDDCYITGGGNVDSSEPDAQPLDYRINNYDTATGERSNPSPVMPVGDLAPVLGAAGTYDAMRQTVSITPAVAYGRGSVRQEAFRRGGPLVDNWYYVGVNAVDGGPITDNSTDETALVAGAVEIDHDQPVTTVDATGTTLYAQPLAILFGPIDGYIFGCGDAYRPGFLYWSKRDEADHWPAANSRQVCSAGDELMTGGIWGGSGYVFSRSRLYTIQVNLMDGSIGVEPTNCTEGPFGRWGVCSGPGGIYFVARDAVRVTQGGQSEILSDAIRPLFYGQSKNGYQPVDWTQPKKIRLTTHGDDLWFGYQDTAGTRMWMVYSITYKTWRAVVFGVATAMVFSDPTTISRSVLYVGGATNGNAYSLIGTTDDGVAISNKIRTGSLFGQSREEKLLGDVVVWANMGGADLTIQPYLNGERCNDAATTIHTSALYDRYIFDLFGTTPQHAQSIALDLSWSSTGAGSSIQALGVALAIQPEITMNRATTWQPLHGEGESYLQGCWIDSDTGGTPRTIYVEGLLNGNLIAIATLAVNSNAGRRQWFSWAAVHVDLVRLRPDGNCISWLLFGQGWIATPQPPRIALWDSGYDNLGDTYYTGLDIECDTFGVAKTIAMYVDNVLISTQNVTTNGRSLIHLTVLASRGHIYHFISTDLNLGLLYSHKWLVDAEPGEQTNWNQNYTIAGSLSDKYLKGILLECDTFGQNKSVTVEVDGVVISTQAVNTAGRKVVHLAFPQALGRVFRLYPTDNFPGRLYSSGWLFDEEPYQLTRYETQEQPDGIADWHMPIGGQVAIKSSAVVVLTVTAYGQKGLILSNQAYNLPSTGSVKSMISLHSYLTAQKGLLYKFVFTSAAGFWLYREESWIDMQATSGGGVRKAQVFGDDDLDRSRIMRNAELIARRGGAGIGLGAATNG